MMRQACGRAKWMIAGLLLGVAFTAQSWGKAMGVKHPAMKFEGNVKELRKAVKPIRIKDDRKLYDLYA